MQVTKDEFLQWKDNPVTQEVFQIIRDRREEAKDVLAISAGEDPVNDRFYVGMIRALSEFLDISFED